MGVFWKILTPWREPGHKEEHFILNMFVFLKIHRIPCEHRIHLLRLISTRRTELCANSHERNCVVHTHLKENSLLLNAYSNEILLLLSLVLCVLRFVLLVL